MEKIRPLSDTPRIPEKKTDSAEPENEEVKSIQEFRRGFLSADSLPTTPFALLDQNQNPVLKDGKPLTVSVGREGGTLMFDVGGLGLRTLGCLERLAM